MRFLDKKNKGRDEDDDGLDFDDDDQGDEEDSEDEGSGIGCGLLGKVLSRLKRGVADEESDEEDEDRDDQDEVSQEDEESGEDPEESPTQSVKLEGVADVRPVGDSAGSLAPGGTSGGVQEGQSAPNPKGQRPDPERTETLNLGPLAGRLKRTRTTRNRLMAEKAMEVGQVEWTCL